MPDQQTNITSETGRDELIAYDPPTLGQADVRANITLAKLDRLARKFALSLLKRYWRAYQERRQRQRLRAALHYLSDRELTDMGITRGEIEYIAAHRAIDSIKDSTTYLWITSRGVM
jgi:uncharacterized protein YjiS (DUF1127 family)